MNPALKTLLKRIQQRGSKRRTLYLRSMDKQHSERSKLAASNLAHSIASFSPLTQDYQANLARVGILTAYNDMLSAHKPFETYPDFIRGHLKGKARVQVAGGLPAMCDGITQGRVGMQLSLFSRDVIAMSSAIALSHDVFDGIIGLGTCDKIVPGMLMGMASFGYLPAIFLPAGPMASGVSHQKKQQARQDFIEGKIDEDALLELEMQTYHGPGTCTFYGTANTNQMLMETMGLHLPGSTFLHPYSKERLAFNLSALDTLMGVLNSHDVQSRSIARVVSEASILNAMVVLLASGGSSNHTLHLPAIARAFGICLDWQDFHDLSAHVPLLVRVYPNGDQDIHAFEREGGLARLLSELDGAGLLSHEVTTICGSGLQNYVSDSLELDPNAQVLRPFDSPFQQQGGLRMLKSERLGRAIVRTSALGNDQMIVKAPAKVFDKPEQVQEAFERGELFSDMVLVLRSQGAKANGMPEHHKLMSYLAICQSKGYSVALLTDGRLSGASAKVLAAIHVSPEAALGGGIAKIRTGDLVCIDVEAAKIEVFVDEKHWQARSVEFIASPEIGAGRELFSCFRQTVGPAHEGATTVLTDH